jgi:hypothetical protein
MTGVSSVAKGCQSNSVDKILGKSLARAAARNVGRQIVSGLLAVGAEGVVGESLLVSTRYQHLRYLDDRCQQLALLTHKEALWNRELVTI